MENELSEIVISRGLLNEEKALKGSRRGNKALEEIDRLESEIIRIEEALNENSKLLIEERSNNEHEFMMNLGRKISYGQKMQFKHLFSDEYLTLNTKSVAHEHGCINLELASPDENSWFVIMPSEKIR